MKTCVSPHSIETYHAIGNLRAKQKSIVLNAVVPGQLYSRRQIARITGVEIGSVTRAVFELIAENYLHEAATIVCPLTTRRVGGIARVQIDVERV
jgi:hypothetical protein